MRRSNWLHELRASLGHSKQSCAHSAKWRPTAARRPRFEPLEERHLLAVLTVNSALDNNTPGDGLVTLREAIIAANANTMTDLGQTGSGADTITFDPVAFATPKTIVPIFGEYAITQTLTIDGPGRDLLTIDAQNNSRILNYTTTTGDFSVSDLTLTRGRVVGGIAEGGAIRKVGSGFLTLDQVNITASSAVSTGSSTRGSGGGIFFDGSVLTISSSSLSGNLAQGNHIQGGGAISARTRTINVTNSTIQNNQALGSSHGGGIWATFDYGSTSGVLLTLTGSTISGNMANGAGGGVSLNAGVITDGSIVGNSSIHEHGGGVSSGIRELVLRRVTVHGNHTAANGGGIGSDGQITLDSSIVSNNTSGVGGAGIYSRGTISLINSTVSGNKTTRNEGGGLEAEYSITLANSTVTNNSSTEGRAGGVYTQNGVLRVFSSIIAGNTAFMSHPDLRSAENNYVLDYSIIGDAAGTSLIEAQTPDARGNRIGNSAGAGIIDPMLSPLANNGGPTQTHALLYGSPAIDANLFPPFPAPSRNYPINGSLAEAQGGPPLTALGGTIQGNLYYGFGPNQGLNASMALANPANYTLEFVFRWTNFTGAWQKIIDFHNLTSNVGLYTVDHGLHFVNGPFVANVFTTEFARLVLTRDDATDIVRAYLDGEEIWNFVDVAGDAVFDGPNQVIRFFQDDTVTGQIEAAAGQVDSIRIYSAALTPVQVSMLPDPFIVPAFDQRDTPFARVRDGDGVGGAQLDIGAFEAQGVVPPPVLDYGDAPDAATGSGAGNYNTRAADNGPNHTIVPGLRIGAVVDGDSGTLQNMSASADDVNGALPDDEDGLSNPAADLVLTVGSQPTVNVRVTNTTGSAATLYGWIDHNANGVFDNATERASIAVPSSTNNSIVTLVFPAVPPGFTGTTYARFRLSTDPAAEHPSGPAGNGEVEDHQAKILGRSDLTADSSKTHQIPSQGDAVPGLDRDDNFGYSVGAIGDVDGDGVIDLAVGALRGTFEANHGAVYVLLMNSDGTVRQSQEFTLPDTPAGSAFFGRSVAGLGDLNGDGVPDIAAGESQYGFGKRPGGVQVLFLNSNGTLKSRLLIARGLNGGPDLGDHDDFGRSIASLGDLDGDGVSDIAVGATGDNGHRGAVHFLFMNPNGTVKSTQKIASGVGGLPTFQASEKFGLGVASLGDIDGDGITDLAVSSERRVYVCFLNANGTVKSTQPLASVFGKAVASLGDLDGDGVGDLAVGDPYHDAGISGESHGAVIMLLLNPKGTVKKSQEISHQTGGGPTLGNRSKFGRAISAIADLDGDGFTDVAVGGSRYIVGDNAGGVHILFLKQVNSNPVISSPPTATVLENTSAVMTVAATDADSPPQTLTFSIIGGVDRSRFNITSGGALSFNSPPDFDAPTDADGNNSYQVIVQASDGNGGIATQTISVFVTPVNEHAPVFTLPDVVNVAEETTAVINLTVTDADRPPPVVTFSIAGGTDQSKFSVTPGGALSFISPPDFEAPTDANGDNIYVVIVRASDGSLTNLHALLVTVTSNNEVPVGLAGDYNASGNVDAADYVVWRNALGSSVDLPNDTTPGSVTQADYNVWRANFGRTEPGSAARTVEIASASAAPAAAFLNNENASGPAATRRPSVFRPTRSNPLAIPTARDDALHAWLLSRSAGRDLRYEPDGDDEVPSDIVDRNEAADDVNALDRAFAKL